MAQHHGGGRAATGGHTGGQAPHHANGGMGQVPAHIQRQMQQQQQQQMRQYQQQMQKMQQEAHRQYQQDVQRFEQWLNAHGGQGGAAGRLPNNPAAFDHWAATQKQRKAQGKSYDPMYDQYRAFAGSATSTKSGQGKSGQGQTQVVKSQSGQSQSGQSQSMARANRHDNSQTGTAGSTSGGSTTSQQAKTTGSTPSAGSSAEQAKHGEHRREERRLEELRHEMRLAEHRREMRRLEELRREERALLASFLARGVLASDQAKVSLLRTVHSRLLQADQDYNGHRVEAINSVGHALNVLGSPTPPGGGVGLGNMPQAQSDGILRDAIIKLRTVQGQLGGTASTATYHDLARTSVGQAIDHLEAALTVR
jgi:hypothetical protein